jgi:hypothetical protein
MTHTVDARGFLIFGGLFLSSRGPLWRNDEAFSEKILAKLSYVLDLAKEERLVPVITGNIFARPHEPADALKTVLIRLLKNSWTPVLCGIGRSDKSGVHLKDSDSLAVIGEAGALIVANGGAIEAIAVDGNFRLGIGFTHHNDALPAAIDQSRESVSGAVWIYHRSPAGQQPQYLPGCNLVVDASNPRETPPVHLRGDDGKATVWQSVGSLARIYEDMAEATLCAWALTKNGFSRRTVPCESLVLAANEVHGAETVSSQRRGGDFAKALLSIRQRDAEKTSPTYALDLVKKNLAQTGAGETTVPLAEKIYAKAILKGKMP